MSPTDFYQNRIVFAESEINIARRKVQRYTFLRLFVFITLGISLYFSWGSAPVFFTVFFVGMAIFLRMVSISVDAKLKLEKAKELKKINESEIAVLNGDWSMFDRGAEFQNAQHAFSNDLDVFSNKGIFGFINRTITARGKKALADLLLNGTNETARNNAIIQALSKEIAWTQTFRVSGSITSREEATRLSVVQLLKTEVKNPSWVKWMIYLVPIMTIPSLVLYQLDLISGLAFTGVLLLAVLPTMSLLKFTNTIATDLGKFEPKMGMMLDQIQSLDKLSSTDPELLALISVLQGTNSAESELYRWFKINKRFEIRMNILVGIPLNIFFAWDLWQRLAIQKWTEKNRTSLVIWEKILSELEVYISGANLLFNYPQTVFASFSEQNELEFRKMTHPLLSSIKAVSNDLQMDDNNQFMILTGPNMAGKSTYLRAVGLIFVMANAGLPVFAESVILPRMKLYSSMRTSDDLSNESSYFYAELTRLKFIMNSLQEEQKIFILLDEILKGTNSKDKEEGSKKFLEKLQRMGAKGIIATHDLSLCELSNEYSAFSNGYFDSIIEEEKLYFDYTWRKGICQNMNASFLLKQMNLVD
jgi:hypothetical protein